MPFQPAPLERDPQQIVENIHPLAAQPEQPDYDSREQMQEFLEERMQGDQSGGLRRVFGRWRVYNPVERTSVGFNRWAYLPPVQDGRGWRRATAVGFLALNIGLNLLNGNIGSNIANAADDIAEELSDVKDDFQDARQLSDSEPCETPGSSTTETIIRIRDTETFYFSPNSAGESNPEVSIVDQLLDKVQNAQADGTVTDIDLMVEGNTSDEWIGLGQAGNYGYGQEEAENDQLATTRVDEESQMLRNLAAERGIDLTGVDLTITHEQNTLNTETQLALEELIANHGFTSLDEVQRIHNSNPDSLPQEVLREFDRHFTRNRDTVLQLTVTKETGSTVANETPIDLDDCVLIDASPEDENHDYDLDMLPFLWPALPLFMRKRITKMKGAWVEFEDLTDPQRLLIHKDGVHENNHLDKAAWAYVRKFMYLFREEGRIRKIYEHGYLDDKGQEQSLKAVFIDHEPTAESVSMVAEMFQFAGQINGGSIGRDCDVVVITPRKNAGLHGNAKRVGMGMDVQYDGGTLGVAIPSLGIVEMHMPHKPTARERDGDYNSAAWVLAHELTGHFSQLNKAPNQLRPAGHNSRGKEVFSLPNRFDFSSLRQYRRSQAETDLANGEDSGRFSMSALRNGRGSLSMRWRARRGLGTTPTPPIADTYVDDVRGTGDRALRESLRIKKQTGNPSQYGSGASHDDERIASLEADAEAAANKRTGIAIPFAEAPERAVRHIQPRDPSRFIGGYDVSDSWDATLDKRWGSQTIDGETTVFADQAQVQPNWTHRMDVPENFDWAARLGAWARSVEIPEPNDPVWTEIIVGQAIADGKVQKELLKRERASRKISV